VDHPSGTRQALVGRDAELLAVERLLDDAGAGKSAVLVISGESGIGKTSLIGELLRRSERRGYRTLSARAAEFERDLPFAVFSGALEGRLSTFELDRLERDELALLRTLLPPLAPAGPAAPGEAAADGARARGHAAGEAPLDQRHRLLRALHALLEALATDRPLVLALDDLHWADTASVDLVCRLLHRGIGRPSLLVLASRPTQTEPRLQSALQETARHGDVRRMDLAVLSAAEAEALLDGIADRGLRAALYRQSGGNPFYLQQLAAANEHRVTANRQSATANQHSVTANERGLTANERGAAIDASEGDVPETRAPAAETRVSAAETRVPAAVRGAIRAEVDALSAPAQILLRGAASVGEPFESDLAAEAAGIAEEGALVALDELLERDLIRSADPPRRFCFRHPIVRQAVYETAGAGWRVAAHRRAAAALQARGAAASARAPHIERSARVGDRTAIALLTEAGQEAMLHAPGSAAHWFEAALRLAPEGEEHREHRFELLAQRAAALGIAGRTEESREALGEYLRRSPKEPSHLRLQVTVLAAILDELRGAHEAGRRLLLDELGRLPDRAGPGAADLERELAFICFLDADWAATADWARQSLAGECEGMVRVGALAALALAELGLGELDEMRRSVAGAAELFDGLSDEQIVAHHPGIGTWLGWAEICSERFEDAIRHLERCITISRAVGQQYLTVVLLVVQGQALVLTGRGEELEALAEAATEAALLSASDLYNSWAMTLRCQASLQAGELHDALRFGERAVDTAAAATSPLSGIARAQLAAALLELDEPARCRALMSTADGQLDLPPFPFHETLCLELLVRAELELGDRERARELTIRAERVAQRLGLKLPLAFARRARAALLLDGGEFHAAAAAALAAAQTARDAGAPVEAARAQLLAGRALAGANERDAAIDQLQAARETFVSCRVFHYSDKAARELRKLGCVIVRSGRRAHDDPRAPGPTARERRPLGLTARELEVIEQVAAGKTNREIAEGLFLSVRTVDRHLSRIFQKLDVSSRAAAASVFERARLQAPA
jgi:DNA-binding CsgD family transcriptional regulator/tetratricopeptide (TPR) repeat protein